MLKIVMPMGGEGKPFADRGFTFPKPLIEIRGRSMIEVVVENLAPRRRDHQFVFVPRQDHLARFALADVLRLLAPGAAVVPMKAATRGALCSVLLATEHLADDCELLVANADQFIDFDVDAFLDAAAAPGVDGCMVTFPSTHPKWSYAKVEGGEVVAVAEKRPISRDATVGLYYFKSSRAFLAAAERSILKNASLGGEFYVAPVYNELILAGRSVRTYPIRRDQMHSLGTPEELDLFAASVAARWDRRPAAADAAAAAAAG
ncbi:MAG TPA: glycosyltransferase family 2 protein, partial [Humisphaera sp.]